MQFQLHDKSDQYETIGIVLGDLCLGLLTLSSTFTRKVMALCLGEDLNLYSEGFQLLDIPHMSALCCLRPDGAHRGN